MKDYDTQEEFTETAKNVMNNIAETDNPTDYEVLEVEYRVGPNKDLRGVKLVVATGGPQIEVYPFKKRVDVWQGTTHATVTADETFDGLQAVEGMERLADYYAEMWEAVR